MNTLQRCLRPGVLAALGSALLFGAGTPLAKQLLSAINPWMLAGLLYLGSGLGLALYRGIIRAPRVRLAPGEWPWFAGAVLAGGVIAPVLLMQGLQGMAASSAALLLNAESVFTAVLAWVAFKENVDRRMAIGMLLLVAGACVLAWSPEAGFEASWPSLAVLGACLAWGVDNNLTRKVALNDATWIASVKGWVSGLVNLTLAFMMGARLPAWPELAGAMTVGLLAYGVSLALFVVGLRHLGTARTGAYFSIAPFIGAVLALAMGEPVTKALLLAGSLMALGLWIHLNERHAHLHRHEPVQHDHEHAHDAHHDHVHEPPVAAGMRHRHLHRHEALSHDHAHFPDAHHRHEH